MTMPRAARSRAGAGTVLALSLVLVAAVVAAFGGSVGNESILLDDPEYVYANAHVLGGLGQGGVAWAFSSIHGGNWHPLTTLSHMLDVELFGRSTSGPHAVNVAWHALAVCAAFLALRRLTGATWTSFAVALCIAVHPLRVESVAWISSRKDVLSGAFFWLTLLAYARWIERPSPARYALLTLGAALGLMSKPTLVTLPFVLLLLDAWPLRRLGDDAAPLRNWHARVREKLPLFALAAAASVTTFLVQRAYGAMQTAENIPLLQRLLNAPVAIVTYLRKSLWPNDLAPYYPFELRASAWVPLACLLALVATTILVLRCRASRPWLASGWLWFLGMLVPVLGIVQVGGQALADRYTYLPSAGLALAVLFEVRRAAEQRAGLRAPLAIAGAVLATAMVFASRSSTEHWHSTRTLAEHMLRVTDRNPFAHQMYGHALLADGNLAGARRELNAALTLAPALPHAHNILGTIASREGRLEEAALDFRAEFVLHPTVDATHNLGLTLSRLQRFDEALSVLRAGLRLDPRHEPSLVRLGIALVLAGRTEEAVVQFEAALEIVPDDLDALRGLASAQLMLGRAGDAVTTLERAMAAARATGDPALVEAVTQQLEAARAVRR